MKTASSLFFRPDYCKPTARDNALQAKLATLLGGHGLGKILNLSVYAGEPARFCETVPQQNAASFLSIEKANHIFSEILVVVRQVPTGYLLNAVDAHTVTSDHEYPEYYYAKNTSVTCPRLATEDSLQSSLIEVCRTIAQKHGKEIPAPTAVI